MKKTLLGKIELKIYDDRTMIANIMNEKYKINIVDFVKRLKAVSKSIPDSDDDIEKYLIDLGSQTILNEEIFKSNF